jgi:hypothetical protein
MNFTYSSTGEGDILGALTRWGIFGTFVLWFTLHWVLTIAVARDIQLLREGSREPRFLGSVGWPFVTLVTGPLGFALYWVMHHSTLRDPKSDVTRPMPAGSRATP